MPLLYGTKTRRPAEVLLNGSKRFAGTQGDATRPTRMAADDNLIANDAAT